MIRVLIAVAVGAFVLSLPIHRTSAAATLRRVAGFCLTLALVPSIVVGLFFQGSVEVNPFVSAVVVAFLVVGAYAVLRVRATVLGDRKVQRVREKTPVDRTRRREQEFLAFIAERPADED